jgi:hypothetical protein
VAVLVVRKAGGCACGADTALTQHIVINIFHDTAGYSSICKSTSELKLGPTARSMLSEVWNIEHLRQS